GFSSTDGGNRPNLTAVHYQQRRFLVGAYKSDLLAVGRDSDQASVYTFVGNGFRLTTAHVLHIKPHALAWLITGEQYSLAVGKPASPESIDLVVRQFSRFSSPGGEQVELNGWLWPTG